MADNDAKFVDLDAAHAERKRRRTPITIRKYGRDWEFPGALPAAVFIRVARWAADGKIGDLSAAEMLAVAADLIPAPVLQAWMDHGYDIEDFGDDLPLILAEYDELVADPGEVEAPTKGAKKKGKSKPRSNGSSNGGPSSKRTSTASTRSRTSSRS